MRSWLALRFATSLLIALAVVSVPACSAKKTAARPAATSAARVDPPDAKPADPPQESAAPVPAAQTAAPAAAKSDDLSALLARVEALLKVLSGRSLDASQIEQRDDGSAFRDQAKDAARDGDSARATLLGNKSVLLLEDLEARTR